MRKIGIIGAGQLGRMLALSGYPLGLRFVFLDKSADAPGGQVGDIILGAFDDAAKLAELADKVDALTFDVENVPVEPLREITKHTPFNPPLDALATAQDRLLEKNLFRHLGLKTTDFIAVNSLAELEKAVGNIGLPAVLKTRRLGYDGKGQRVLRTQADIAPAFEALGDVPLILENFIEFDCEVSIIAVRSTTGEQAFYPLSHNTHRDGILRVSVAPYDDNNLQTQAERYANDLMQHFNYAGVLTIEFFVKDGELIANEIAPRVHNSGHWTIEGAITSQFENHIRAILGLPLGDTNARGYAAMVNFIGTMPGVEQVLAIRGAHHHDYGKSPRPGRKLGHSTLTADSKQALDEKLKTVLSLVTTD
ncbi:MAG TPA: 5-(carboxyamino)imidazole ribonucleotide synthase [Gammaproteobacteria bacterium]|nr:5-(carboxyamino)imidazole ribonucleotide synthase [Gammaproteobacteria bacterium]